LLNAAAAASNTHSSSYFYGSNIPGKPRRILFNLAGRPAMMEMMNEVIDNDFKGFVAEAES
jgi:hypothetical protein